jgi:hypothetical protein
MPEFRRGNLVEVKSADEIGLTLDADGSKDNLPFMPEMLQYCGKRFRVASRALMVCYSGAGSPRGFRGDDVVTLDGVRCTGDAHDGCQKACLIFWREAWLRRADDTPSSAAKTLDAKERLGKLVATSSNSTTFYCQASELAKATDVLTRQKRLETYIAGFVTGNFSTTRMIGDVVIWAFWRIRRAFFGVYARGTGRSIAAEDLGLQPGEWVEVKPMSSIKDTLNERGENRGLYFSPDMRLLCGRRFKVKSRIDQIIVDGTGEQRRLRNTVCLEGSTCGCAYMGFGMGGCSRCEVTYWRESWLYRVDGP